MTAPRCCGTSVLLLLATGSALGADPPVRIEPKFEWVTEESHPALWAKVQDAFSDELRPDDPEKTAPYAAMRFKFLHKIGCLSGSCFVLIRLRPEKDLDPEGDYFLAYDFNPASGRKAKLGPEPEKGFYLWEFHGLARFDRGSTPDIVFTWRDCYGCEADHLLSSFSFHERLGLWRVRVWSDGQTSLFVGSDDQFGEEEDWHYDCRFKVEDLTGDGLDDVGVWCRVKGLSTGKVDDEVLLYSVGPSGPKKTELTGKKALQLKKTLCAKTPEVLPCDMLGPRR